MRRFFWIWLTLLGAWWTAATLVSAALYQRVERGSDALLRPVLVTLVQALVLWWVTRPRTTGEERASEGAEGEWEE